MSASEVQGQPELEPADMVRAYYVESCNVIMSSAVPLTKARVSSDHIPDE